MKKFMQDYYSQIKEESNGGDRTAVALELVKGKIVDIFLDEVKATYAVIKVDGHIETVPIKSERFEDSIGVQVKNGWREDPH